MNRRTPAEFRGQGGDIIPLLSGFSGVEGADVRSRRSTRGCSAILAARECTLPLPLPRLDREGEEGWDRRRLGEGESASESEWELEEMEADHLASMCATYSLRTAVSYR